MGQGASLNSNNFNLNIPPLLNPIMNTTLRSSSKSLSIITSGMQPTNMPITTRTYQEGKDKHYEGLYSLDKVIDFTPQCCRIILYDEYQMIFYYVVNFCLRCSCFNGVGVSFYCAYVFNIRVSVYLHIAEYPHIPY